MLFSDWRRLGGLMRLSIRGLSGLLLAFVKRLMLASDFSVIIKRRILPIREAKNVHDVQDISLLLTLLSIFVLVTALTNAIVVRPSGAGQSLQTIAGDVPWSSRRAPTPGPSRSKIVPIRLQSC
ncbi:hypothetical protein QAD02_001168 [Eretmocerus hayati]|uniref:Uncharacterized protein n=1 Tax=Eretmocerus hayati TaxID=131215 RepID=A0ACC2NF87_9HYME|nr:hypothetical protein QAD02_001168 [Eretmocerus hayati]